jgi:penicillin-binding protein 1A
MTEDDRNGHASTAQADRVATVHELRPKREQPRRGLFRRRRRRRRRIRWLRLIAILIPLAFLALISFVFGIVLAYEPQIEVLTAQLKALYTNGVSSTVYDVENKPIGYLTANNQVFLPPQDIPPIMAHAIVAIEDKRFYSEPGVDLRGIARAFIADVFHTGGGVQGASTITEQFVKLALKQQKNRTLLEKLREAAMAFQLSHLWSKQTILAEYLDTAYFGSGANGVEAAAKAYFGADPASPLYDCGQRPDIKVPSSLCVTYLTADEAALLAAAVDAPSDFNGLQDASAALDRRNLVLRDMQQQGYLSPAAAATAEATSLPPPQYVGSPFEQGTTPTDGYFVNWIENQMYARYHERIYTGGYHIHTTLNQELQDDAQHIVNLALPPGVGGPSAALVAIDNSTGEVRTMVGGYNYFSDPYNLATEGERQPGSAFKVFDLAAALEDGYGPNSRLLSSPFDDNSRTFGTFAVKNDEGGYYYSKIPLSLALDVSDNSVFSRLGLRVGPRNIARLANQFGVSTTVSFNPSMVIGGLHIGVTPLDMAHAYETIAQSGVVTSGTLASYQCASGYSHKDRWEEAPPIGAGPGGSCPGPVGIMSIFRPNTGLYVSNERRTYPVYPAGYASVERSMMRGVLSPIGTAASAYIPGVAAWGKTGTTNNYADAWFVGSTPPMGSVPSMTVAVWVGYPTGDRSMLHNYGGHPVYGGTYPAQIWRQYMEDAIGYYRAHAHHNVTTHSISSGSSGGAPVSTPSTTPATGANTTQSSSSATGNAATTPATGTGNGAPATGASSPAGAQATPPSTTPASTPPSTTYTPPPASTTPSAPTGGAAPSNTPGTTAPSTGAPTNAPPTSTPPVTNTPSSTPPSTGSGGGVTAPSSASGG